MNQSKQFSSGSGGRVIRSLGLASMVTFTLALGLTASARGASRTELPLRFAPIPAVVTAVPPLPSLAQFPVQLVLDDDTSEATVGVAGATARQFLWFNRFTPSGSFELEETWVLFPAGANMAVGAAVEVAVYQDTDGNPVNGATLLATFNETIQAVDGNTFSVYSTPVSFSGGGDLLIGVVPRFIVSGVTTATDPAALDATASQARSWVAIWTTDPPSPPALTPPPDLVIGLIDGSLPGNWLIRGFGTPPPVVTVPTVGEYGMILLALALALAATFVLRRRGRQGRPGRVVAAILLALASAGVAEAQVTIDTFTTNQAAVNDPPVNSNSTATGGADILGTKRGLAPRLLAGAGPTAVSVAGGNLVFAVTATTPDSRGEARISWDADNNALVLTPTGLGTQNLTAGSSSGFRVRVVSTTAANMELNFTVHSDASNSSRAARLLPLIGAATNIFIPFSEFRTATGTGANFASVGAIELTVRATEATVTIDEILTSAPTVAATKVDLQVTDVDGDTRVDPGDRLRYTITLTNTGNEALNVALADTIDTNTMLVAGSVSSTPIARDDQYVSVGNVALAADGTPPGLLANDADPDGDTITVQAITSPSAQGGTVSLVSAATGTFTYSPPVGFKGVDSFTYTIVDDNANTSTATATITMDQRVWFVDDVHPGTNVGTLANPFVGILPGNLGGAGGAGDVDTPGDIIFVFAGAHNGIELEADEQLIGEGEGLTLNGDPIVPVGVHPVHSNAGGSGILLSTNNRVRGVNVGNTSAAGLSGTSFGTLDIANSSIAGTGPVLSLTTGNLAAVFTSLVTTSSASTAISLTGVTGSLSSGSGTNLAGVTGTGILVSGGTASLDFGATTVGATAGGIDLAGATTANVTLSSLAATTSAGFGVRATSGTINLTGVSNTIAATGGPAADLVSMSLGSGATFSTLSSTNSSGDGVNLDTVSGSFVATGGAVSGAAGIGFDLNAGSSTVTYGGSITHTANNFLAEVTARTGGTTTLSGTLSGTSSSNGLNVASNTGGMINFSGATKTLNTGGDAAVTLATNTGATINFTGGGLDIDTTSGTGFNATGGATAITVQGTGNSLTSTTGTALNVASTTIGASGLTFQSIASTGGTNGIVLNTTGSTGGLTVTGTGSAGSGGTIQSKTGPGISLTSTSAVSLSFLNVASGTDDGIRGSTVTGFSLAGVQVTANGNAAGEAGIDMSNLLGSSTWSNVTVSGSAEDNVVIRNSSGVLTSLAVTGSSFTSNSSIGNDGFLVESSGTANITVSLTGNTFTAHRGDHFQGSAVNSGVLDVVFTGNTLSGGHATALGQGITISAATGVPGFAGAVDYNIDNNIVNGAILSAITANLGTSAAGSNMRGTITGNAIGTVGSFQSGSTQASGITVEAHGNGTHTTLVTGNTIRQTFDRGINVLANDGNGTLNMTVTGNNSSHSDGTNSREGFFLNNGSADPNIFGAPDGHFVCLTLGGAGALRNTLTHGPGAPDDFRLRQRFSSTIRLPSYGGSATDTAAVVTFVNGNNISVTGSATVNSPPGGGFVGGAACPLPP